MNSINVILISDKLESKFYDLSKGKYEQKELYAKINYAMDLLKETPETGVKIRKKLWPKEYKQYNLTTLFKYNLNQDWRLLYTIETKENKTTCIVLEWLNHKEYEKRFKY